MSKSLNIFLPTLGGVGLVLGGAYGLTSRDHARDNIQMLEKRLGVLEERVSSATATAAAEATRAAELETQVVQVQAKAREEVSAVTAASAAQVQQVQAAAAQQVQAAQDAIAKAQESATAAQMPASADLTAPAPAQDGAYGIGRSALPEEIAAWDVDVLPDGRGLPEGSGDVFTGEEVFIEKCASCHGDFAEGVDNWPVLAGGFDTLADKDPVKTIGSYWPHLSTAWDYIHRSMPFGGAGELSADETYAIVAYLLYSNDLVDDEFVLSHENFAEFEMYNKDGFIVDDRPEREYAAWRAEPCMTNCKDKVEVTGRSVFLVETPPEGGTVSEMNPAASEPLPSFTAAGPDYVPAAAGTPAPAPEPTPEVAEPQPEPEAAPAPQEDAAAPAQSEVDPALVAAGEKVFKKCRACHEVGEGAKDKTGPQLNDLFSRTMGGVEGFKYSKGFKAAFEEGRVWDEAALADFLRKPRGFMPGTKMSFSGLKKDADLLAITAYLKSLGR